MINKRLEKDQDIDHEKYVKKHQIINVNILNDEELLMDEQYEFKSWKREFLLRNKEFLDEHESINKIEDLEKE